MPTIRVNTADGFLVSVLVKTADLPHTLLATITGGAIVNTGGGAYTVDVGALTGNWMLICQDASNEILDILYANGMYLLAASYPPWLQASPPIGPVKVGLTLKDSLSLAVLPSILVRLTNASQSLVGATNAAGYVEFYVSPGTWTIAVSQAGYTYTPTAFAYTVDTAQDVLLASATVVAPSDPMLSVVDFYVWGAAGPLQNARVVASIDLINNHTASWLVSKTVHSGTTDANGHCQLQLIRLSAFTKGGTYEIKCFDASGLPLYTRRVTVPDAAQQNAAALTNVE